LVRARRIEESAEIDDAAAVAAPLPRATAEAATEVESCEIRSQLSGIQPCESERGTVPSGPCAKSADE
jgi:hypothetical protein